MNKVYKIGYEKLDLRNTKKIALVHTLKHPALRLN